MDIDVKTTSDELRNQAEALLEEAKTVKRIEDSYASAKEAAIRLGNLRDCLMVEGFEPSEAFELLKLIVMGGTK